ncbi:MAG: hypothetical protein IV086_07715 [Hyphomonadaceae bacterium]|nr:MAG: curlin-associated protein [Caulobacteraceae bacterium]MBT9445566.1 hypothetical protein [Hyphomonadaceae bacterium]TPW06976.1 MAG: curlin-associated protein [Alphaproteobacteria bacterium]
MTMKVRGLFVALALIGAGATGVAHADDHGRWERASARSGDRAEERDGVSVRPGIGRQRGGRQAAANAASVAQQGGPSSVSIAQNGSGNAVIVRQIGQGSTATVQQNGDNNTACIIQIGPSLDTTVVQNGNGQSTGVLQTPRGSREIPVSACTSRSFRPNVRPGMDRR